MNILSNLPSAQGVVLGLSEICNSSLSDTLLVIWEKHECYNSHYHPLERHRYYNRVQCFYLVLLCCVWPPKVSIWIQCSTMILNKRHTLTHTQNQLLWVAPTQKDFGCLTIIFSKVVSSNSARRCFKLSYIIELSWVNEKYFTVEC